MQALSCGWEPGAFYTIAVGNHTIQHGRYTEAVALLRRGYDQAAEEGRPYLMLLGSLLLGNCYSAIGHRGLMMEHYQVARRLGEELGQTELLAAIDYNIAATYLEWGMDREALTLLEAAPRRICGTGISWPLPWSGRAAWGRPGRRWQRLMATARNFTAVRRWKRSWTW